MKAIKNLETLSEKYYSPLITSLRIMLGVFICLRGIVFISNTAYISELLSSNLKSQNPSVGYIIAGMLLFSGIFLIMGLMTRVVSLILIPIIIGTTSNLLLLIGLVSLLIIFAILGSGKFSVYYYMINSRKSRETDESKKEFPGIPLTHPLDKEGNIV